MLTPEQVADYKKLLEVPENISAGLTSYTTNPAPIALAARKSPKP
jgi:hypothetical protein